MTINNTFTMTSTNATRIYLPCKINENLSMEALKALWENGQDAEDIKSMTTYLVPHVSRIRPTLGYIVEIFTNDGQQITKKVYVNNSTDEAAVILDRFFAAGAPGLDAEFRECFEQQLTAYHNRSQRCAA